MGMYTNPQDKYDRKPSDFPVIIFLGVFLLLSDLRAGLIFAGAIAFFLLISRNKKNDN